MLRRERILSPRGVAETISEAHRLWAAEISAAGELGTATDEEKTGQLQQKYADDLRRIAQMLSALPSNSSLLQLNPSVYPLTLKHFEWALESLETLADKQARELGESLIPLEPMKGVACGLYTTSHGLGGLLAVQCSVRPLVAGEKQVSVTGHATSSLLGQAAVPDDSVLQSADNAVEAVRAWLWNAARIELGRLHMHFQIRSLSEGAPAQGVSGPSAGLAMFVALVSELAQVPCSPSKVMTGTIGVKLDVGPVGGLGGFGDEAGKLVGILKTKRIRVTDLFVPKVNFEKACDEMSVLSQEDVEIHPVSRVQDVLKLLLGSAENRLVARIESGLAWSSAFQKEKGAVTNRRPRRLVSVIL
jgi:ATP-dependent Lon protease